MCNFFFIIQPVSSYTMKKKKKKQTVVVFWILWGIGSVRETAQEASLKHTQRRRRETNNFSSNTRKIWTNRQFVLILKRTSKRFFFLTLFCFFLQHFGWTDDVSILNARQPNDLTASAGFQPVRPQDYLTSFLWLYYSSVNVVKRHFLWDAEPIEWDERGNN